MKYFKLITTIIFTFFIGVFCVNALEVESINIKDKSNTIEVTNPIVENNIIESTIKFHEVDDFVTFEIVLNNLESTIKEISDNNENEYIKTSYEFDGSTILVTLKYDKELVGTLELDDIVITITFNDNTKENIIINPKTYDNIYKMIILFIISICGLLLVLKIHRKEVKALLVILLMVPLVLVAKEELNTSFIIKNENIKIIRDFSISFNPNGGSVDEEGFNITEGSTIGDLPIPVKAKCYFLGWYSDSEFKNKVSSDYKPTGSITLYAKWIKTVENANITNASITIKPNENETINISNPSDIEEEYEFSSNKESIATVNSNGKVVGVKKGNATISITGKTSGKKVTVDVVVESLFTFVNRQNDQAISVGDEVSIGSEHFYVLNTNEENTALMAKYNLYVGDIFDWSFGNFTYVSTISEDDPLYGIQNELAKAGDMNETRWYGGVPFSGINYWDKSDCGCVGKNCDCNGSENGLYEKYNESIYDSSLSTEPLNRFYNYNSKGMSVSQRNNYTISYYVENYISRLKEMGAPLTIKGRLINEEEIVVFERDSWNYFTSTVPEWLYSTTYWTQAVVNNLYLVVIGTDGGLRPDMYIYGNEIGVRPVIDVDTSDL